MELDLKREIDQAIARLAKQSVPSFEELLTFNNERLAQCDIGVMNLVCATGLPGAEENIRVYLRRLEAIAATARYKTPEKIERYRADPSWCQLPDQGTDAFFRVAAIVSLLKHDLGQHYNDERKRDDLSHLGFRDSKDLLINGLLSHELRGTCNSIPVVIVAVGRRLGYPLYISANRFHIFARWDDGKERFNIDASCPGGFGSEDDEHYREFPHKMDEGDIACGYYLKNFTPADELALFLFSRAWVLSSNGRFEEALLAWAKCCYLAPREPQYPDRAARDMFDALYFRKHGRIVPRKWMDGPALTEEELDPRDLLPPKLAAVALSIGGHYYEGRGKTGKAILNYQEAHKLDPDNPDYAADLDRFRRLIHEKSQESLKKATEALKKQWPASVVKTTAIEQGDAPNAPFTSPADESTALLLHANVLQHEYRGRQFEKEGKWPEAQASIMRAWSFASANERRMLNAYLKRVIRREFLAPPLPPTQHELKEDPRQSLPIPLQGVLWASRGKVLEDMDRLAEAISAYAQACALVPENPQYKTLLHAAQSRKPKQITAAADKPPPGNICLPFPITLLTARERWSVPSITSSDKVSHGKEN